MSDLMSLKSLMTLKFELQNLKTGEIFISARDKKLDGLLVSSSFIISSFIETKERGRMRKIVMKQSF